MIYYLIDIRHSIVYIISHVERNVNKIFIDANKKKNTDVCKREGLIRYLFIRIVAVTYEAKMQKFSGTLEKLSPLSAIHIMHCAFIG